MKRELLTLPLSIIVGSLLASLISEGLNWSKFTIDFNISSLELAIVMLAFAVNFDSWKESETLTRFSNKKQELMNPILKHITTVCAGFCVLLMVEFPSIAIGAALCFIAGFLATYAVLKLLRIAIVRISRLILENNETERQVERT